MAAVISFGGHGLLPGQFQGLVGIAIDKNNRVFTSEIFPGRVQQFRYVSDAEAEQQRKEREAAREKKAQATLSYSDVALRARSPRSALAAGSSLRLHSLANWES